MTSALLIAAWSGSALVSFDGVQPRWIAMGIDAVVFVVLVCAALYSARCWTRPAAAFQLLILATHFVFVEDARLVQWAYMLG